MKRFTKRDFPPNRAGVRAGGSGAPSMWKPPVIRPGRVQADADRIKAEVEAEVKAERDAERAALKLARQRRMIELRAELKAKAEMREAAKLAKVNERLESDLQADRDREERAYRRAGRIAPGTVMELCNFAGCGKYPADHLQNRYRLCPWHDPLSKERFRHGMWVEAIQASAGTGKAIAKRRGVLIQEGHRWSLLHLRGGRVDRMAVVFGVDMSDTAMPVAAVLEFDRMHTVPAAEREILETYAERGARWDAEQYAFVLA